MFVVRGGGQTRIMLGDHGAEVNVSDEIPELSRGGEAVAVYDRLRTEGYIHVDYWGVDPTNEFTQAALSGLSTKGLIDVGKFPDPDERLARAFEQARNIVAQDSSIPPDEKQQMLDTVSKLVGILHSGAGLGQIVANNLLPPGGGGG